MSTLSEFLLNIDSDLLQEDGFSPQVRNDDVVLLAHLHCLTSTVQLFQHLIANIGLRAKQIILISKPYSTIDLAIKSMESLGITVVKDECQFKSGYYDEAASRTLKKGCEAANRICQILERQGRRPRLVIVDDGGMLTESWWRHFRADDVVSIQQTASGIRRNPRPSIIPKIDVSRSAAKRMFEAHVISSGVLKKVQELELLKDAKCVGIVGVGALGKALAMRLQEGGHKVYTYDVRGGCDVAGATPTGHLPTLLSHSDVVFGCTGRNFLRLDTLKRLRRNKIIHFISCSSRDVEFMNLLRCAIDHQGGYSRVSATCSGRQYFIENGGFPINFDRLHEQETSDEIALTRGLVLAGILQALCIDNCSSHPNALMLSPRIQQRLVRLWLDLTGSDCKNFNVSEDNFNDISWWHRNSIGALQEQDIPLSKLDHASSRGVVDSGRLWGVRDVSGAPTAAISSVKTARPYPAGHRPLR